MSEGAYRRSVAKCLQACNERLARRRCRHSLAVARLIAQKKKGFRGCGTPSWFLIELHEPNSVVGATPKACSVSPLAPSPSAPACNVRRRFRRSLRYSLGSFPEFAEKEEVCEDQDESDWGNPAHSRLIHVLAVQGGISIHVRSRGMSKREKEATGNSQPKTLHRHDKSITRAMAA